MEKIKVGEWVTIVVREYSGYIEKVSEHNITLSNNLPAAGMQHEATSIDNSSIVRVEPNPDMKVRLN